MLTDLGIQALKSAANKDNCLHAGEKGKGVGFLDETQGSIMPVCKAASPQCIQLVNRESQRYELCSPSIGLSLLLGMGGQGLKGLVAAYVVLQQPFKLSLHSHTINKLSSHLLLAALGEAANPAGSTFSCDAEGPLSRSSNPSPAASIR